MGLRNRMENLFLAGLVLGVLGSRTDSVFGESLTDVLSGMEANASKMPSFGMRVEAKAFWPRLAEGECEGDLHILESYYDGSRTDVRSIRYDIYGGKPKRAYEYRSIFAANRILHRQQDVENPGQPVMVHVSRSESFQKILEAPCQIDLLFGKFSGENQAVWAILKSSKEVRLIEPMETVDGYVCHIVEGKTSCGTIRIWVDPAHGYAIRKAVVHKEGGDLFYGKPLTESGNGGHSEYCKVDIEVSDVCVEKLGEWYFPARETIVMIMTRADGTSNPKRYVRKRFAIEEHPDFVGRGAFVMDGIPEGTMIWNDDPKDFGYAYEWREGKIQSVGRNEDGTVSGRVVHAAPSTGDYEGSIRGRIRREYTGGEDISAPQASRAYQGYWFPIQNDGTFRIERVPARTYTLLIEEVEFGEDGRSKSVSFISHEFTLAKNKEGVPETLHVGELALQPLGKPLSAGESAPEFEIQGIDGRMIRLSDYRGRYVLIHFWATWCAPCIAEMPKLKELYATLEQNERLVMIGLSLDDKEETVKKYAETKSISWRQACAGTKAGKAIRSEYRIQGIPMLFLIDPKGKILRSGIHPNEVPALLNKDPG